MASEVECGDAKTAANPLENTKPPPSKDGNPTLAITDEPEKIKNELAGKDVSAQKEDPEDDGTPFIPVVSHRRRSGGRGQHCLLLTVLLLVLVFLIFVVFYYLWYSDQSKSHHKSEKGHGQRPRGGSSKGKGRTGNHGHPSEEVPQKEAPVQRKEGKQGEIEDNAPHAKESTQGDAGNEANELKTKPKKLQPSVPSKPAWVKNGGQQKTPSAVGVIGSPTAWPTLADGVKAPEEGKGKTSNENQVGNFLGRKRIFRLSCSLPF